MKRMSPEQYKGEAHRRVVNLWLDLVTRFSEWNAKKIMREMEKGLKNKRINK